MTLLDLIARTPDPTYLGDHNPRPEDASWRFYLYCVVQQCGTGLRTTEDTIGCGDIWDRYLEDWRSNRRLFGSVSLTYSEYQDLLVPPTATYRISEGRMLTRYLMHQNVQEQHNRLGPLILSPEGMRSISAYQADRYHKKRNLLWNILHNREDQRHRVPDEGGPVVDYHVMRVLARVKNWSDLDLPQLRERAYQWILDIHGPDRSFNQIDVALWKHGRETCTRDRPRCNQCQLDCALRHYNHYQEPRVESFFY